MEFHENISIICKVIGKKLSCDGILYVEEEGPISYDDNRFWIYAGIYCGLVLIAGLMSGLTMGLLSLDLTSLKVLQEGGKPHERKHAAKIIPLVERHHLLLVTLLLSNAAAVETMPLCLDRISDPITAILVSVTAVLLFGEIVPQALCTRYGLAIGAALSPLVYALMAISFVIAYPISKLLDCILGEEHGTFYRRAELKVLVGMHGENHPTEHNDANEEPLCQDEILIIKGALELASKKVRDAMIPWASVFKLNTEAALTDTMLQKIMWAGHSRIPIYHSQPNNVVGILLVKSLIFLNSSHGAPLLNLLGTRCMKPVYRVHDLMSLYELLNVFQTGKSHLAIVHNSEGLERDQLKTDPKPEAEVVGIITLEDVIEELIQEEIYDESDTELMRYQMGHALRLARITGFRNNKLTQSENDWHREPLTSASPQGGIQSANEEQNHYSYEVDETTPLLNNCSFP